MAAPASTLPRLVLPAALALVVLLSTWQDSRGVPYEPQDLAGGLLQGTWLREVQERGTRARRVLTLAPDGAFRETVRVVDAGGRVTQHEHSGIWFFDGTNLKRKYRLMDGEPPSRLHLPFATFQIAFEGRNEFVGTDHIHGNQVRYRRVPAETQP